MSKKHVTEHNEQLKLEQETPVSEGADSQAEQSAEPIAGSAMLEALGAPAELVEAAKVEEGKTPAVLEVVKLVQPEPVKILFGIGQLARELILKTSKSNAEILAIVQKTFPNGATTPACIAWYKTDLRKKGLLAATEKRGSSKTVTLTEEQLQELLK
jgi:hypothetical protein